MPKAKSEHIRQRDLPSAITNPKDSQKTKAVKEIRYNANGESDESNSKKFLDKEACAKKVTGLKNPGYKIKARRGGQLYNPLKEGEYGYGLNKNDRVNGQEMFAYKDVSPKAFDAYINFLKNRHDSLLTIAEREV